jgi:chloramphenicol O-acetyltransferase type A
LPWLKFTAFSNALTMRDSIPRVVFGKCVPSSDRIVMPVGVEVHHAVVHGLDVARFYDRLQERLSDPPA